MRQSNLDQPFIDIILYKWIYLQFIKLYNKLLPNLKILCVNYI